MPKNKTRNNKSGTVYEYATGILNTGCAKISTRISNMNYLFAALSIATKSTALLHRPLTVLFYLVTVT
jgi:hypothetical protein